MTSVSDLIGDPAAIAAMDDAAFGQYWAALGQLVRIAAQHAQPEPAETPPQRDPTSTTSTTTQIAGPARANRRHTSAQPFGFGTQA